MQVSSSLISDCAGRRMDGWIAGGLTACIIQASSTWAVKSALKVKLESSIAAADASPINQTIYVADKFQVLLKDAIQSG